MKAAIFFLGLVTLTNSGFAAPNIKSFDAFTLHTISEIIQNCPNEFAKMTSNNQTLLSLLSMDSSNPIDNKSVIVITLQSGYLPTPLSGTSIPTVSSYLVMTQVEKSGRHPLDGGEYYDTKCKYTLLK